MAYQTFKKRDINYLNKDFSDFRNQLINYSQTYFPQSYTDFSPSSPGMMFMEQAAYVGDVLSFYVDNQVQENFIQYSRQTQNLYELAYMYSYKPKVTGLANTDITIYQLLPAVASASAFIPDWDYALLFPQNLSIASTENQSLSFVTQDVVDLTFSSSVSPTNVTVAQISGTEPTYYLISKKVKAVSGAIQSTTFTFGDYVPFPTVSINAANIANIIDVFDSNQNEYYEVDYLGQDMVYDSIRNTDANDPQNLVEDDAPYILKLRSVQNRFTTRFINSGSLQLQFGSGNNENVDEEIVPNPMNVGLGLPFEENKLTTAFSPTNFIFTNTYGQAPSNTTLTVRYLSGGGVFSNVVANSLTNISTTGVRFFKQNLNSVTAQYIFNSIQSNNIQAASGGNNGDSAEEIRQNTLSSFSTQLRNVTADDYLIRALSMPPKFGVVSKAYTSKPKAGSSSTATLCMYVLSTDINGYLTTASTGVKNNLKTYLNQYRVIGDSLEIKDAYVINIKVDFEIITLPNYNSNEVLTSISKRVRRIYK